MPRENIKKKIDAEAARRVADLTTARKRIAAIRRRLSDTYIDLIGAVAEIPVRDDRQRRAILREIGVGKSEAARLVKSSKSLADFPAILTQVTCPPDVIDAVLTARDDVRALALEQLGSGYQIERAGLAKIRIALDASSPLALVRERKRALETQADLALKSRIQGFRDRCNQLLAGMIDFENTLEAEADHGRKKELVIRLSKDIAEALPTLFDLDRVADVIKFLEAEEHVDHVSRTEVGTQERKNIKALRSHVRNDWSENDIQLAEAVSAIRRLAEGHFARLGFVDPELDQNLEFGLFGKIAWLAGEDVSYLEAARAAFRAEREDGIDYGYRTTNDEEPVLTSIEICAGAGGEALGLHAAGFRPVGIFEQDKDAVATLFANNIFGPLHKIDVRKFDFTPFRGKVDLLAGGVPCQPFSSLGHKLRERDERDLFSFTLHMVDVIRPKAVMLENVLPFLHSANTYYRAEICGGLHKLGYETRLITISAKEYGLAQKRQRAVLIAFRDGVMSRFREPPKFPEWQLTTGDALFDLMSANGWQGAETWRQRAFGPAPTLVGASDKSSRGFAAFNQIGDWATIGVSARNIGSAAPTADAPVDLLPEITLEMGKRLQGFPDHWRLQGSPKQQRRQIANAFPPVMAGAIGLAIKQALGYEVDYRETLGKLRFIPKWNRKWARFYRGRYRKRRSGKGYRGSFGRIVINPARKNKVCGPLKPGRWYFKEGMLRDLVETPLRLGLPLGELLGSRYDAVQKQQLFSFDDLPLVDVEARSTQKSFSGRWKTKNRFPAVRTPGTAAVRSNPETEEIAA